MTKKLPNKIECPKCGGLMYYWDELRNYLHCYKCGYHEGTKKEDMDKVKPIKVQNTQNRPIKQING